MAKNDKAVEKPGTQAVSTIPEWMKGDLRGTEHITKDDIQLPRIGLAQKMSPQLSKREAAYIEGLEEGDLFNTLTGEIIAQPLTFVLVRSDKPRGIEFIPRDQGGGIKDFNVPLDDPRMEFGPNGEPPVATKFYDYVLLPMPLNLEDPMAGMIALSCKGSNLKVARQLNALIKMSSAPLFGKQYTLTTVPAKNQKGEFFVFHIKQAGFVQDKATFDVAAAVFEQIRDREIKIDRENEELDPDAPDAEKF